LEQFWQAFASRGFVSDSWAFLLIVINAVLEIYLAYLGNVYTSLRSDKRCNNRICCVSLELSQQSLAAIRHLCQRFAFYCTDWTYL